MISKELQRKILFPWDGSPLAEHALGFATFLAPRLGTELVIFQAFLPARADLVAAPDFSGKDMTASADNEAEKAAAQLCTSCAKEANANWEAVVVDAAREALSNLREEL